jgi:pyridoxamine 5'-phosphate oxidase
MTDAELLESQVDCNPFIQFSRWYEEAARHQPHLPEAMTVSTCGADGVVTSRVCLLKSFDEHGFVFFTNYHSRKGAQISENPRVSLCFHWPHLEHLFSPRTPILLVCLIQN